MGRVPCAHCAIPTKDAAARMLAEHRIARIEERQIQDRYPRSVGRNAKGSPQGTGGVRRFRILTTDKGASGWAMAYTTDAEVQKFIGARVGDLFDVERGSVEDVRPLDKVFYDLAANILGLPVYAMIGAKGPREIPIYSGAIYFDDLEPPARPRGVAGVIASCRQDYEAGYRAFKLKIGRGFKHMPHAEGLKRDIDVTRAVRETFPDCKILVDANDAYTRDEFIAYLNAVADCDLYFIEEPFAENRDDLLRLREVMSKVGCKAMIAEGEGRTDASKAPWRYGGYSEKHIEHLYALAAEKLVDVFVLDLDIVGFTNWRHVMPELVKAGGKASPHLWAGTPRPYYTAHLAAGVGNVVIIEGIPGRLVQADYSAFTISNGNLVVPDVPGFGLALKG